MKEIEYIIWKEGKYYVSQCINSSISSFGETIEEATNNLKEAVELYYEGEELDLPIINEVLIGRGMVNV
jgi:predicted RNase H-like HicB family nuclease